MVAAHTASWSHILTQVAESLDNLVEQPTADILILKPALSTFEASLRLSRKDFGDTEMMPVVHQPAVNDSDLLSVDFENEAEEVSDWMSTIDIINGMAGLADEQKKRIADQGASHELALEALRSDLKEALQRLRLSEIRGQENQTLADIRMQKMQADADAQVQEIRAEAETRVRTIRAETEAWLRAAEEQVRIADLRADTAEKWLHRIDAAAKNLLLGGHMNLA